MEISPYLGVLIMMNNYFHDVATAMLLSSGVAIWVIMTRYDARPDRDERAVSEYFLSLYHSMTRVARFSLYWILLGGIPRTVFYRDFEWDKAVGYAQVPAIIVKHIFAFALVGAGVYVWIRMAKRAKAIEEGLGAGKA